LGFWLGGIIGTILPDLDHLIYILYLKPNEATSQKVNRLIEKGEILKTFQVLTVTRNERKSLIFHTIAFQALFFILVFWTITSTGSILGRGLVLAFALHLLVDQVVDLTQTKSLDTWFRGIYPLRSGVDSEKATFYWLASFIVLILFGFFF